MTRSATRTTTLDDSADRAPRHSVQRLVGNPRFINPKIFGKNLQTLSDSRPCRHAGKCNRETRETDLTKSASIHSVLPCLRIQQQLTKETEDRVRPRSLRGLLFNPRGVAPRRTTPRMTYRRRKTADASL